LDQTLREAAPEYHRLPAPGKISVMLTKAMATQRDLSLGYSPGVAERPARRSSKARSKPVSSRHAPIW